MAAPFRSVWKIPLIMAVFTLVAATSSFAEKITLDTVMPQNLDRSGAYVIGDIDANLTVTGTSSEGPATQHWTILFHTIPWTAPKTGSIFITWHNPGVGVVAAESVGGSVWLILGFSIGIDDECANPVFLWIPPPSDRRPRVLFYPPIVATFYVTQGTEYTISLRYRSLITYTGAVFAETSLLNDSGKRSIIEIEYVSNA